ncbi:hypothetical protein HXX76_005159 [Chlamydomonas incerta]|uniref:Uncharacterized protein n=1 Tax=Chlamydomonas incerta TaxID=51695 RepID=A0A835W434_CHLIN|nr:hypothetical protein HXX76_005159 [Chlamydomonas incerta]|eukprot:KAG2438610.1 hypothetical protein HXX76_005159 [Chlamydomonas incerta]
MRGDASLTRGASAAGATPAALGAAGWRAGTGASTSNAGELVARNFPQLPSAPASSAWHIGATSAAAAGRALPGQLPTHVRCFSVSRGCAADAAAGSGGDGGGGGDKRMSLGEALNTLVDAAIEKVEAGDMGEAVSLLKEGLNTFEPVFPNSPELGELHNQTALLLLFQNKGEEAAYHAGVSLETTKRHFGATGILTGHRLLRLGVAKFVQGKMSEAAGLLREAYGIFGGGDSSASPSAPPSPAAASADPGSRAEAGFYLDLVALAHCRDAGGVNALTPSLRANLRALKEAYGLESMILSLALAQHSRLTHGGLEQADLAVGEALMQQHIGLLTDLVGPDAEDVAVARYKLATYYYANDMLHDAAAAVKQAATSLRAHYPEEHDMLVLCRHRLGMICAAQGDHRSATQLLTASRQHFLEAQGAAAGAAGAPGPAEAAGEGQGHNMLAKEADIGLAMARCRAVGGRSAAQQAEALESLRKEVESLARAIGEGHMLVQGASRYYTALSKMAR